MRHSGFARSRFTSAAVLAGLGVTQILAWGATFYLLAVLAQPIAEDTGWPLTWIVSGVSVGLLVAGIVSPSAGRRIQRYGGRPVLAASSAILAVGLVVLASSASLPAYMVSWMLIGLGMGTGLYDAAFATLGRIYGQDARSRITALTLIAGFSSTLCWPLSAYLVELAGWRATCLVYAALMLAVALPIHMLVLPRQSDGLDRDEVVRRDDDGSEAARGPAVDKNMRTPFLLVAAAMTLSGMIMSVISVHIIVILQTTGLSIAAAVGVAALIGPSQVAGRVTEMAFGHRYHPVWTLLASTVLITIGLVLLLVELRLPALAVAAYGAGVGINWIVRGTLPLVLFGPKRYPILMGRLAVPSLIALALSPILGGLMLEHAGVPATMVALVGLSLVALCVTLILFRWAR